MTLHIKTARGLTQDDKEHLTGTGRDHEVGTRGVIGLQPEPAGLSAFTREEAKGPPKGFPLWFPVLSRGNGTPRGPLPLNNF